MNSTLPIATQSITPTPGVPYIPESAPFSPEQRQYLNGLLAGLLTGSGASTAGSQPTPALPLTILVGTESGNCNSLARKLKKEAAAAGFAPDIIDLGNFEPATIKNLRHVVILTSTHGDGHPPENAHGFHTYLFSDDAPRVDGLNFSVLALGDRNYPQFCQCGKDFDRRLEELGGKRFQDRVDCDVDYEPGYKQWSQGVLASLKALDSETIGAAVSESPGPRVQQDGAAKPLVFNRANPLNVKLIRSVNLNSADSDKETRHIEISLGESGLSYEPGDALGVYPVNCPAAVQSILDALNADGEEAVEIHTEETVPLRYALTHHYEVRNIKPAFLRRLSEAHDLEALAGLLETGNQRELAAFIEEREIIDVLLEYPGVFQCPQALIECLEKLQPRLYSIASSPRAVGENVHLTVGVVRYDSLGRERKGVCSSFLAERAGDEALRVFVQPNRNFRLPADGDIPIIMVGPGTGIAPFRSFLQERQATAATGGAWLFFGDRHEQNDFLYRGELEGFRDAGVLTRFDTAWSRDHGEKVYVQQRMLENGAELFKWLEAGAVLYVCGDAQRMAPDVETALLEVIRIHGSNTESDASKYLEALRKKKRYLRDVY